LHRPCASSLGSGANAARAGSSPAEDAALVRSTLHYTYRTARRIVVATIGATVVVIGIAMIVLPGPAFIVIPAGLGILSIEFAFARRWLHAIREQGQNAVDRWRGMPPKPAAK
jgi:uncharacterized protein (TIGR02611 family)